MGRPGQKVLKDEDGLADRISLGLLARVFPRATVEAVVLPSEEALSRARARLGPVPMRLLFESVAGPLASPDTPGGFWRGRRVLSIDGTTLDVQDTEANWARFGGPGTRDESGAGLQGGFPKVRVVALAECG